jgi:hypothetical protein
MKYVDAIYEFIYGDGQYDHVLVFSGIVDSERYNEEQHQYSVLTDIIIICVICAIGTLLL